MSWHCGYCGSSDNEKIWAMSMISPIDGGIPITIVFHLECFMKTIPNEIGCDSIKETIQWRIDDAKETKELWKKKEQEDGKRFQKVL